MKKHLKLFTVLVPLFVLSASAGDQFAAIGDDRLASLTVGANTYTNISITRVTATDVYFTYNKGMGNAKLKDLSPELKEHFHYDEAKAASIEKKQAQANTQYHVFVAGQPTVKGPDESRLPDSPSPSQSQSPAQWGTDFSDALAQAQSQHKLVLMDFTGSDWCQWCIKFDQDVLSTSRFASYAQSKLILVRVDFPHNTPQPEMVRHANRDLASRFNVDGYPTFVLVDSSGKELGRQVGYAQGGPEAFIAKLDGFSR